MEKIAEYANTRIWYHAEQRFMKCERYCRADEFIWDEDYRAQMMRFVEIVREKLPLVILMDLREFFYPVTPEQQAWINQEVIPAMLSAGVCKGAFLLPADIVAALSVEQIYDREEANRLPVRMFDDLQRALKWLGVCL